MVRRLALASLQSFPDRAADYVDTVLHILEEKSGGLVDQSVEVLVEDKHKNRWRGRTPQNKLVFFEDERDLRGQLVNVIVEWAGPYSLVGSPAG